MKKTKTDPGEIWREYEEGRAYKANIDLYDTVRRNENFFVGKQWEDVVAPDLEKPVLNFLRRVVTYFIAMITSADIGISLKPFEQGEESLRGAKFLEAAAERLIERCGIKSLSRELIRNCAVHGDGCFYFYFDPERPSGQSAAGDIAVELIENTKVIFANPFHADVQRQRHILLVQRLLLEDARELALACGADAEAIRPDTADYQGEEADIGKGLVSVIIKLWRDSESKTIKYTKTTKDTIMTPETDTGYRLYPISYMSWERVQSSCHGAGAISGLIPNQIFVNKLWAMAMQHVKLSAFPKVFYDKTRIAEWSNKVGQAVGVVGNPNEAVASNFRAGDMSGQLLELVDRTINYTKEFMGASDAALGNVRPDNTSAIIAVQKANAVPLELQRMAYYQFTEDYIRVMIDMMRVHYGARRVMMEGDEGTISATMDFSLINADALEMNVDVGSSSYWSELTQIQTLDNLLGRGIITDAALYLESLPDKFVPNRQKIIDALRRKEESSAMKSATAAAEMAQLQAAQAATQAGAMPGMPGGSKSIGAQGEFGLV